MLLGLINQNEPTNYILGTWDDILAFDSVLSPDEMMQVAGGAI